MVTKAVKKQTNIKKADNSEIKDVEVFDSNARDEIKKNIHKELNSLKKLKKKTEKITKDITEKVKEKIKNVDVNKIKEPAMYIAVGAVAGIILSKLFGRK